MESALVRGRSATNLPSLGRLEVAGGAIHAFAWPQLAAQLQSCASLHSLRLCNCPGLTDTLLASVLLPSCPRLRSLTLTRLRLRAPSIESPTLCALTLSECEELTSPRVACDRLHTLCFSGSDRLVDPHVASADLEALDLSGCPQLAAPRLECPSLRVLDLSACTALRAESVQAQVDTSPKLRTLRLSGCRGLRELSLASPSIVTLHACWCTHLRTVTLQCPALQSLHTYGCGKLAQADVRAGSPTRFELQKCGAVDDALLAALTAAPRAARLELLNLTDCKALRAPRLVCARLRTLHPTTASQRTHALLSRARAPQPDTLRRARGDRPLVSKARDAPLRGLQAPARRGDGPRDPHVRRASDSRHEGMPLTERRDACGGGGAPPEASGGL